MKQIPYIYKDSFGWDLYFQSTKKQWWKWKEILKKSFEIISMFFFSFQFYLNLQRIETFQPIHSLKFSLILQHVTLKFPFMPPASKGKGNN